MPTPARSLSARLFLGATLLVGATSALTAQPVGPRGGQRGGPPPVEPGAPLGRPEAGPGAPMLRQRLAERPLGVTAIINLRRRLELTPRQLMQLDSIERGVAAQRTALMAQLRAEARRSGGPGGPGAVPRVGAVRPMPDSVRARLAALRPQVEQLRRTDSAATAAAERILTEPQRAQLREARAFARGRASAARGAARGAGMRARGGMRGGMRGPMMGPRPGMGMRGGMGPRPGMGMGGRGWMGPGPQPGIRPGVRPRG